MERKQSTSPMIPSSPDADVSQIWTWMSPGKKKLAESLAMWIVRMTPEAVTNIFIVDTVVIKDNVYLPKTLPLALPQCNTEEDVLYKVANVGLAALGTSEQATMEECRNYCRHL